MQFWSNFNLQVWHDLTLIDVYLKLWELILISASTNLKKGPDAVKCSGAVKCEFLEFDVEDIVNLQMPGHGPGFNQNVVFLLVVLWP